MHVIVFTQYILADIVETFTLSMEGRKFYSVML